jgi:hypothetical protein
LKRLSGISEAGGTLLPGESVGEDVHTFRYGGDPTERAGSPPGQRTVTVSLTEGDPVCDALVETDPAAGVDGPVPEGFELQVAYIRLPLTTTTAAITEPNTRLGLFNPMSYAAGLSGSGHPVPACYRAPPIDTSSGGRAINFGSSSDRRLTDGA